MLNDTLCWSCKNACGGCSWSEVDKSTNKLRFQPVEGWTADETKVRIGCAQSGRYKTSYLVRACPLFEEG